MNKNLLKSHLETVLESLYRDPDDIQAVVDHDVCPEYPDQSRKLGNRSSYTSWVIL